MGEGPQTGRKLAHHVWRTFVLAWPMVLSRVGIVAMSTADVIVLGRAGSEPLADYILGLAIHDSLIAMVVGLMLGVPVLVAREHGAGNDAAIGVIWRRGLSYAAVMGMALCFALQFSEHLYLATGQAPDLARRAGEVTAMLSVSLPLVALFVVCTSFLEAVHRPAIGMYAIGLANVVNLALNIVLVYGAGPIPAMGALGCALATTITSALLAAGGIFHVRFVMRDRFRFGMMGDLKPRDPVPPAREQLRVGFAAGGSYLFEASSFAVMTMFVGWLGTLQLAAHGVLFQFLALSFMIAYGLAGATQVRVSNAWGRGDEGDAVMAGWTGLGVAVFCTGFLTFLITLDPMYSLCMFTTDKAVVDAATPVLMWVLLAMVFDGSQTVMTNACRGRGDSWVPTLLNFSAYWLVMVPMAWLLAFGDGRGLTGIYQGILIASVISITILSMRFHALMFTPVRQ